MAGRADARRAAAGALRWRACSALLFGWFCVRLSGVYLAMLTLAFAQIAWSVAFQWASVTGGDNGILGVWPDAWAAPRWSSTTSRWRSALGATLMLRRIIYAPFGYALRAAARQRAAGRGDRHRCLRIRWLAFALAGRCGGLAGGLFAYAKGSVFPDLDGASRAASMRW